MWPSDLASCECIGRGRKGKVKSGWSLVIVGSLYRSENLTKGKNLSSIPDSSWLLSSRVSTELVHAQQPLVHWDRLENMKEAHGMYRIQDGQLSRSAATLYPDTSGFLEE